MKNPHMGSSLDEVFEEEGTLAEVNTLAIKRVLAWQVRQEMQRRGITKTKMAAAMHTSRASLERLLDPGNTAVTLKTLDRAAAVLGKRLQIELVDAQVPEPATAREYETRTGELPIP